MVARSVTRDIVEQTVDPSGNYDPAALRAMAWGGDYDLKARRDAIALALMKQAAEKVAQQQTVAATSPALGQSVALNNPSVGVGGTQAGDANPSSISMDQAFSNTPGFNEGAPPGGSMFGDRTASVSDFAPGAMTTANAAMSTAGSGELGPLGTNNTVGQVNPFSEGAATGRFGFGDTQNSPFGGRGGGKEGFGEAITMGTPTPTGYAPDFNQATPNADIAITGNKSTGPVDVFAGGKNDFFGSPNSGALPSPGVFDPSATFATPSPNAPGYDPDMDTGGLVGGIMGQVAGSLADLGAMSGGGGRGGTGGGAVGGRGGGGGATSGYGDFGAAMAAANAADAAVSNSMASAMASQGAPGGFGFGGGFANTGGYEGSASMSNTGGAQGFTGAAAQGSADAAAAAVGALGSGDAGPGSGSGSGSGSGGGSGGSEGSGSSSDSGAGAGSSGVG